MGCFSTNCAVSKLPIYGHPVVGIPIVKNPSNLSFRVACYPDTDWQLDGFPFFGVNDEYGRIKDFEKGKYHTLNLKRYGKIDKDLMGEWSSPRKNDKSEGTKSIMFIHRPIWDEIMKRWLPSSRAYYSHAFEQENLYKKEERKSFKKALEKMSAENKKKFQETFDNVLIKAPSFQHDGSGFSFEFSRWYNKNFSLKVKTALYELLALSISCQSTHTLYTSPSTIGDQISNWKEEASWTQFVADFAATEWKERVDDGCD